ncbi:MAG: hypothetical protein MUO21_10670 [Nitrososphaeraceae archaeon]|nr:hypothetical protein [Nitrososphaeraceae archaeon]
MQSNFVSDTSKDEVDLVLIKKSHKALFTLKCVDNVIDHIKLIKSVENSMRKEDIKWIEFDINFSPLMPPNSITYLNKHNGNIVCHIEDFLKFYFMNINNFIQLGHIHYEDISKDKQKNGGWILVGGPKKGKKVKYDEIIKELSKIILL